MISYSLSHVGSQINSISIVVDGEIHVVKNDHVAFDDILEILGSGNSESRKEELLEKISVKKYVENLSPRISIQDEFVCYDGEPVNEKLSSIILTFLEKKFDISHYTRFLDKLMQNPSKRSVDLVYEFISRYNMPITPEGNFLCLKAVTSEFLDKHSRKINNSPGQVVEYARNKISDDPNHACHEGLHCGWHGYMHSFARENDRIVMVEVNPADVVCIPNDCSMQKMRVCKYKVLKDMGSWESFRGSNIPNKFDSGVHASQIEEDYSESVCPECHELNEDCECCSECGHYDCECEKGEYRCGC